MYIYIYIYIYISIIIISYDIVISSLVSISHISNAIYQYISYHTTSWSSSHPSALPSCLSGTFGVGFRKPQIRGNFGFGGGWAAQKAAKHAQNSDQTYRKLAFWWFVFSIILKWSSRISKTWSVMIHDDLWFRGPQVYLAPHRWRPVCIYTLERAARIRSNGVFTCPNPLYYKLYI